MYCGKYVRISVQIQTGFGSLFPVKCRKCPTYLLNVDHLLKFIDLRKTPSLEFGMMIIFSYSPYALAEGLHLSGWYISAVYFFRGGE